MAAEITSTLTCCIIPVACTLLASPVVTVDWNYTRSFYWNYDGTSHCWPSCCILPPSPSVSLGCFRAVFSGLLACRSVPDPERCPAVTLMTAAVLGTASPPVVAANICLERSLQEPTNPNHRPSSRRVGVTIERLHIYLLLRARRRKGQVLSFSGPPHLAFSLKVNSSGDTCSQKVKLDPALRVMIFLIPVAWQYPSQSTAIQLETISHVE